VLADGVHGARGIGAQTLDVFGEVLADAEVLARAGDEHRTHALVRAGLGQGVAELLLERAVQGVRGIRSVEDNGREAVMDAVLHERGGVIGHADLFR